MSNISILLRDITVSADISAPSHSTLKSLISQMQQNDRGVVVILEGEKPVGILTERDVVRLLYAGVDLDRQADLFTFKPLITASENRTIGYALNIMLENGIRRLVVTDDSGRFRGVITQKDLLDHLEDDFYRASLRVKHIFDRLKGLVCATRYETIMSVLEKMVRNNVSGVPVVESGVAEGIITEKDILRLSQQDVSLQEPVCEYMSSPVVSATPESLLLDIVKTMNTRGIRRIIIQDARGQAVSVLTHRDLVRNLEGDYNQFLERKLKYSKDFLNLLPEMMFELIDTGEEQLVVWANEKVLARFGKKIIDQPVTALVPADRWKAMYLTLRTKSKLEEVKFKKDERTYEFSGFYIPLDKSSEIGRIQLILKDITGEVMRDGTDLLTSLYSRQYLNESLAKEVKRCQRHGKKFSLVMADVDGLKRVNDAYGHPAGDTVLRGVAETIMGQLRQYDIVGRYGGEEFLLILPETTGEEAAGVADKIRSRIESQEINLSESVTEKVTVSFGVAGFDKDGQSADDLLVTANERLGRAKTEGKNRVVWT